MSTLPTDLVAAIARIPVLARVPVGEMTVATLPGLTNRNYKLTARGSSYVLRVPGAGTEKYIDREAEAHDAALAAQAGLTPEIVFAEPASGLMLTRFVEGAETLTPVTVRDPIMMAQAAQLLRRLHDSGLVFRREMRLFDKIDSYLQKSPRAAAQFGEVRRAAEPLRGVIDGPGRRLVPCHIDPTPSNFIRGRAPDGGSRMYLIDWEYAEMSEPAYDLAGLSIEAEFSEAEEAALLRAYGEGVPGATPDRIAAYKSVLYLMAGSWAAMAVELGNSLPELGAMAEQRRKQAMESLPSSRIDDPSPVDWRAFDWLGSDTNGVPYYLHPLNLRWSPQGADHDLLLFRQVADRLSTDPAYWSALIRSHWRPTLIACTCILVSGNRRFFDDLRYRFELGSFVTPQLAVTMGLIHPEETQSFFELALANQRPSEDRERMFCAAWVLAKLASRPTPTITPDQIHSPGFRRAAMAERVLSAHWDFWSHRLRKTERWS